MSRRRTAVAALERLQQRCAVESELEELQQLVTESLTLVESSSSTARGILEGITAMGLSCVALADEVGLRVVVAESLGDALCATAQLFAAEDEESSTQDRTIDRLKFNHRHATAKFLEPLGAAMDGLVLDISHSLARAEVEMHQDPEALEMLSLHHAPAESASTEAVRLYRALTAVCMWLLAIAVRGIGYSHFSADALWDFAGEDAYSAVLFAKGALCFEQFAEDTDASYVEDLPELRDAIMGALLGLCRHDIAFRDCVDPEANIDISIRNEQLALHRATVAAAAARQQLMPCLLAFPWRTGLMGDKRLPELVSFLRETVDSGSFPRWSAFLNSLGEDVDEWRREVRWFTELWSLMDLAPPKRGVLRDLAALARVAPPNEVACRALLQRCLSSASHDAVALASLVAVANYAGLQPGGDVLSAVLSHLEDAQRQQVAEKLRSMPHAEAWAELLEERLKTRDGVMMHGPIPFEYPKVSLDHSCNVTCDCDCICVPSDRWVSGAVIGFTVGLAVGGWICLTLAFWYSDDDVWHERFALWPVMTPPHPTTWWIVTPGLDIYPEQLNLDGEQGPARIRIKGLTFRYWSRFGQPTYRFAEEFADEDLKGWIKEAMDEAKKANQWDDAKIPATVINRKGEEGYVWVAEETVSGRVLGEELDVTPGCGLMIDFDIGLVQIGSQWIRGRKKKIEEVHSFVEELQKRYSSRQLSISPLERVRESAVKKDEDAEAENAEEAVSEDARVLPIDYDGQGERYKEFKVVIQESEEYSFKDWPMEGPLCALHLLKQMHRSGGTPKGWLQTWARFKSIQENDRIMFELRTLVDSLEIGCCYDQVNVPALASFETIARRVMAIVDAFSAGSSASPDWGAAKIITNYRGPEDVVSPQLRQWAARKGKEEVELHAARTKIRDARKLATSEEAGAIADGSLPAAVRQLHSLSRRSQQRFDRKRHIYADVQQAVEGLNWMNGFSPKFEFSSDPDPMQQEVLDRIMHLSRVAGFKGSVPSLQPEAALRELLHGREEYDASSVPISLARFDIERISLPSSLDGVPDVMDIIPEEARQFLKSPEQMVREDTSNIDLVTPYWDPLLKNNRGCYKALMKKLHDIGYLRYTRYPEARAGMFFVHKSDKKKIRLIVDARPANQLFNNPPGVHLCTSEGFARMELELPSSVEPGSPAFEEHLKSRGLVFGLADVKDCFHRLRQPEWLSKYFCWDPIPASWVKGLIGTMVDGKKVDRGDMLYPMPSSLCMGFSWSLYFAQKANENLMSRVPVLKNSQIMSDRGFPVVFEPEKENTVRHYVYVDNLGIVSSNRELVREGLDELSPYFDDQGLILHPEKYIKCILWEV
eukprot:symbB.v1.2.033418.t1/scaffold4147.1/size43859/1